MSAENQDHTTELVVLAVAGVAVISAVGIGSITAGMTNTLVQAGLLVAATESPLVPLPGASGAGLDVGRLLLIVGVLVITIGLVVAARQTTRRKQRSI